jgi:hypothetical protein
VLRCFNNIHVRSVAFPATEYNEVLSSYQLIARENFIVQYPCYMGPCHHGKAHSRVADGNTDDISRSFNGLDELVPIMSQNINQS